MPSLFIENWSFARGRRQSVHLETDDDDFRRKCREQVDEAVKEYHQLLRELRAIAPREKEERTEKEMEKAKGARRWSTGALDTELK